MAIDLEKAVPLSDVHKYVARGPGVRPVNPSTICRWCLKGVRRIVLESAVCGGRRDTDRAAIARFIAATTAAREPRPNSPAPPQAPLAPMGDRSHEIAAAAEGLARAGI